MTAYLASVTENPTIAMPTQQMLDTIFSSPDSINASKDDAIRLARARLEQTAAQPDPEQATPEQLAIAESILREVASQIQMLEAELANADPDEKAEISAKIANLTDISKEVLRARSSGSAKALTSLLNVSTTSAVINDAIEETADGVEPAATDEIDDYISVRATTDEPEEQIQTTNPYIVLPHADAQSFLAENTQQLATDAPELASLMLLQTVIDDNLVLHKLIHKCDEHCDVALQLLVEVASKSGNAELSELVKTLNDLHEQDGVSHRWLTSLVGALREDKIDVNMLISTANAYIYGEEGVVDGKPFVKQGILQALDEMVQHSFESLPDNLRNTLIAELGEELTPKQLNNYVKTCKNSGLLDKEVVDAAYEHLKTGGEQIMHDDALIVAIAAFDHNLTLHKQLMDMQTAYVHMPEGDKDAFISELSSVQQEMPPYFSEMVHQLIHQKMDVEQPVVAMDAVQIEHFLDALICGDIETAQKLASGDEVAITQHCHHHEELAHQPVAEAAEMQMVAGSEPTHTVTEVDAHGNLIEIDEKDIRRS